MAHEITKTDQVVLHKKVAWHGLGLVVEQAPTPREALTLAGLDWGVTSRPLFVVDDAGERQLVETHVANYRADNNELLGVVTEGYRTVSNSDMADFCEALLPDSIVRCETAGSVRGGKRVWFLLKGAEFHVAHGDSIFPYILVSNGHDGGTSFRVTPTTIRAVCSNTLHAIIPQADTGELLGSALCIRHTVNVMERVADARRALEHYGRCIKEVQTLAGTLSAAEVDSDKAKAFFLECYTADFGPIPENPKDAWEERRRNRAMSAYNSFSRRFDDEKGLAGTSMWNAFNAWSGLVQHDLKATGKTDEDRIDRRIDSNLFGLAQQRTQAALRRAHKLVLAS